MVTTGSSFRAVYRETYWLCVSPGISGGCGRLTKHAWLVIGAFIIKLDELRIIDSLRRHFRVLRWVIPDTDEAATRSFDRL